MINLLEAEKSLRVGDWLQIQYYMQMMQQAKLNDVGDTESGGPWDAVQMGQNGLRLYGKIGFSF